MKFGARQIVTGKVPVLHLYVQCMYHDTLKLIYTVKTI